ncbi:MAG: hypothetical protein QOD40_1948 [Alphaproteobacteria bacterium]|jgi:nitrite reductase/ring-hydroxylating ferredoxin subunit|nr:hypothetical protein [Alphaproteobacteria bacterium]
MGNPLTRDVPVCGTQFHSQYNPPNAGRQAIMTTPTRIELCKTEEVAAGEAKRVDAAGLELAVFNVDGEFYVTDDACTHGPGLLHEGYIDGDVVECNFHNGAFNIRTGAVAAPPCMVPVKTYRTIVEDGKVFIEP